MHAGNEAAGSGLPAAMVHVCVKPPDKLWISNATAVTGTWIGWKWLKRKVRKPRPQKSRAAQAAMRASK